MSSLHALRHSEGDWSTGSLSRLSPDNEYLQAWTNVNERNNLGNATVAVDNIRKVCSFTGSEHYDHAHVLSHSNQSTSVLEMWLTTLKSLPRDALEKRKRKMHQTNLIGLHKILAPYMEPIRTGFVFMLTRQCLLDLIRHMEMILFGCQQSDQSFLGFNSNDLLADWQQRLGDDNLYEYEGWIVNQELGFRRVERFILDNNMRESFTDHWWNRDLSRNPRIYQPPLPSVSLVLSPLNVVLCTWKALYRQRDSIRLDTEQHERLFVLGDYLLKLAEVDRPTSILDLERPGCIDFPLPSQVENPNKTFRFPPIGSELEISWGKTRGSKRRAEDESNKEGKPKERAAASKESKGEKDATPNRRRSQRVQQQQQRGTAPQQAPHSPPSPGLTEVDTSLEDDELPLTSPDEPIAHFPSDSSSWETPSTYSAWISRKASMHALDNSEKLPRWQRWEKSIEAELETMRASIRAQIFPDGQVTSARLNDLRYFVDLELEDKMTEKQRIIEDIQNMIAQVQTTL